MRNLIFIGWLLLSAVPGSAEEPSAEWKLSAAESQKWLARVQVLVQHPKWTVAAQGNEITISRNESAARRWYSPDPEADKNEEPDEELMLQLVLQFGSKMFTEEFERLAAVNAASQQKQEQLHTAVGLPHKFDQFAAKTPKEKARVQAYHEAVAKLPRHVLPDFYTPEYSIYFIHRWHLWSHPADKSVQEELMHIEETLTRYFGMYDPLAVAGRTLVGQYGWK